MATPYITPAILLAQPAGISWTVVPALTAPGDEQTAQLWDVCWKATSIADTYCRQPLRATANTESGTGPGNARIAADRGNGNGVLVTRRWPVTAVAAIQVAQARSFPPDWSPVPAGQYLIRNPVIVNSGPVPETGPSGGNAIDVAPGYIDWRYGRRGQRVQWSYVSGWPHTSLTAAVAAGAETIEVDDVTGWAQTAGFTGFAYDSVQSEAVTVTAASADSPAELPDDAGTVNAGPGTLTLASPLSYAHGAGTVISAMPRNALHGVALHAVVQALEAIDAVATQSVSGQLAGATPALQAQAQALLGDFRSWA